MDIWTMPKRRPPPPAMTPLTPAARAGCSASSATMAVLMLSSVVLTLVFAMSAPAHPADRQVPVLTLGGDSDMAIMQGADTWFWLWMAAAC